MIAKIHGEGTQGLGCGTYPIRTFADVRDPSVETLEETAEGLARVIRTL